ncbi:MAG TPA: GGDEF domain-containing protein [Candidatus Polarisedimenticolaceae bacterium]|nr:GGDEF domain-containing protein [Candidatus Polarisedimenticolaceae bacterium]
MEAPRLGERARTKLLHLLSDDHPDPVVWVARLRSFREFETAPAFASAVQVLFQLDLDDAEAEHLLEHVLDHRAALVTTLGRDPGIRVAAMDYLSNVEKRYANPKIVEMEEFEETERSARTDPLTGLANRRVFDEALDREIRRSRRYGWPLTVVMADLDHFKVVNDSFGHLLGDLVLERAGEVLRHAVREADVASRYGGEEFAIVLPETPRVGGFAVAERIRCRIARAFSERGVGGHEVALSISCGLATYPDDGLHAVEIVARADEALYGAKRAGRNRVCVHHREKRGAFRFPLKATALVTLATKASPGAQAVNVSRTGALVAGAAGLGVDDPVALRWSAGFEVEGRVTRVDGTTAGIAFDHPVAEERVMEHVSLARPLSRAGRRARR